MSIHELGAASLVAFATTTFLMTITPGPAVMQVVGHSVSNGWQVSQASILGIFAANAIYCALSVLGLGAVILASQARRWFRGTLRPRPRRPLGRRPAGSGGLGGHGDAAQSMIVPSS
jgi:hypothetical protein